MNCCVNATSASLLCNVSYVRPRTRNPGPRSSTLCCRIPLPATVRSRRLPVLRSSSPAAARRVQPSSGLWFPSSRPDSQSCPAFAASRRSVSAFPLKSVKDYRVAQRSVLRLERQNAPRRCELHRRFVRSGVSAARHRLGLRIRLNRSWQPKDGAQPPASAGLAKEIGAVS